MKNQEITIYNVVFIFVVFFAVISFATYIQTCFLSEKSKTEEGVCTVVDLSIYFLFTFLIYPCYQ
jgi:hypothetical protein